MIDDGGEIWGRTKLGDVWSTANRDQSAHGELLVGSHGEKRETGDRREGDRGQGTCIDIRHRGKRTSRDKGQHANQIYGVPDMKT